VKKTAVLIDAAFLRAFLPKTFAYADLAKVIERFALSCVSDCDDEQVQRILYYDCAPYNGNDAHKLHPLDPGRTPNSAAYRNYWNSVLTSLKAKPYFDVRLGEVSFDGWQLSDRAARDILTKARPLMADDFFPVLRQKGVELRIGLDVALMAKDRLIDRIVVVSGDAHIVPAMKVARRQGLQVVIAMLSHTKPSLMEHADLHRKVDLPGAVAAMSS